MPDLDLSIGDPQPVEAGGDLGELDYADDLELEGEAPPVADSAVRAILIALGAGATQLVGDPDVPRHWQFTPDELDGIVPPLTRIVNNRPALRAAVARGDHLAVGIHLAGYAGRNIGDLQRARTARGDDVNGEGNDGVEPWRPAPGAAARHAGGGDGDGVPAGAGRA